MAKKTKAIKIDLTGKQEKQLSKLAKGTHSKLHFKKRAQIILLAHEDMNNSEISRQCNCVRKTVRKWRDRWHEASPEINYVEKEEPHNLKSTIKSVLEDAYRSGRSQKFKPEQLAEIVNLACQKPELLGLPFTHWSRNTLANEAKKRKIVDSISGRHVGRLLDEVDLKPHLVKGWIYTKENDPEVFKKQTQKVCKTYQKSIKLEKDKNTHVICADEMCGIQAIQHCHPGMPSRSGYIERYEQEYKRNGTTGIIASRNVVTGEIIEPLIQPKRKEKDFVNHIAQVIDKNPDANYIFVMDQLNTHKSESLVKLVINKCNLDIDQKTLGKKGSSGILKSMKTRADFLSAPDHNIQIVYTPKHASWLNQIEIWFSIIKRHLLNKRASFNSVEELEHRIKEYIDYYNENLAKPFKWTYDAKLLKA
jgi:transposase